MLLRPEKNSLVISDYHDNCPHVQLNKVVHSLLFCWLVTIEKYHSHTGFVLQYLEEFMTKTRRQTVRELEYKQL